MRYIAILNPAAGHGRAGRKQAVLEDAFRAAGLACELWCSSARGHAVALAREAAGRADVVVAIGGDGTIHEVAKGLIEAGGGARLAVIPLGTGNDFVKMTGMPCDPAAAAKALATAVPVSIDYGVVRWQERGVEGSEPFVNAVGVGFDASVAVEAERHRGWPGALRYLAAVLHVLRRWPGPEVRITGSLAGADDAGHRLLYEGRLLLATAGNGVSSGGAFRLTPRASVTDGRLDLCVVAHARPARILQVLPLALRGRHEMAREVHIYPVSSVEIITGALLPIHADGEILATEAGKVEIEIVSGGLPALLIT